MLKIGNRVKLTQRVAECFSRGRGGFNWMNRRGEVARITRSSAFIRWEGRASVDEWPIAAIERVADDPNG